MHLTFLYIVQNISVSLSDLFADTCIPRMMWSYILLPNVINLIFYSCFLVHAYISVLFDKSLYCPSYAIITFWVRQYAVVLGVGLF